MILSLIYIAPLLSQCSFTGVSMTTFISFKTLTSQMIYETAVALLIYSAFADQLLTVCNFLDFQDMSELPNFTSYLVTDLLVLGQAA